MINRMSKRGELGNQISIFVFFMLLMIVAAGIVVGVFLFYGKSYDFRQVDAEVTRFNIKQCILDNTINWKDVSDFYTKCNFNRQVFEKEMTLKILENGKEVLKWKDDVACDLASKNIGYPRCTNETFSKNVNGQSTSYFILIGSNQKSIREVVS